MNIIFELAGGTFGHLKDLLNNIVQSKWIWNTNISIKFTFQTIEIFNISPRPTELQSGNGFINFTRDGGILFWIDLEPVLHDLVGTDIFRQMIAQENFYSSEFKAKVLLMFEIARRVDGFPYLSRDETEYAITSIFSGKPTVSNAQLGIKYLLVMFGCKQVEQFEVFPLDQSIQPDVRRKYYYALCHMSNPVQPQLVDPVNTSGMNNLYLY